MDSVGKSLKCLSSKLLTFMNNQTERNHNQSMVISPLSVFSSIVVLLLGADGKLRETLLEILSRSDILDQQFLGEYSTLIDSLLSTNKNMENEKPQASGKMKFEMRCLLREDKILNEDFKKKLSTYLNVVPQIFIANEAGELKRSLDNFVSTITEGLFTDCQLRFTPDLAFATLIATYFKQNWKKQFKTRYTYNGTFINNCGEEERVRMMYAQDYPISFGNEPTNRFTRYDIAYDSDYVYTIVVVSDTSLKHLQAIAKSFEKNFNILDTFKMKRKIVDEFHMPQILLKSEIELFDILCNINGKPPNVSLQNMMTGPYFLTSKHACALKINESGTEAAAVSSTCVADGINENYFKVKINKPFMSVIWNKRYPLVPLFVTLVGSVKDYQE